jgi:glycosyltransferase involved in cell wall biosynthesis
MIDESGMDCELVIVDDGSTDSTHEAIVECQKANDFVKSVRHRRNFGKTKALLSGLEVCDGEILVLLDADLQYKPKDVPKLVEELLKGFDVVSGWKSGKYEKQTVSSIYNRLSRWLFDIPVHDQNSVKAFRREVLDELPLRKDWHRYLIALARDRGYRISEVRVELHPRQYGTPKYTGSWRIVIGILDMIAVKFQLSFMKKPIRDGRRSLLDRRARHRARLALPPFRTRPRVPTAPLPRGSPHPRGAFALRPGLSGRGYRKRTREDLEAGREGP